MGLEEFSSPNQSADTPDDYSREDDLLIQIEGYCKQFAAQKEYIKPEDIAIVADGDRAKVQLILEEAEDFETQEQNGTIVFENPFFVRGD